MNTGTQSLVSGAAARPIDAAVAAQDIVLLHGWGSGRQVFASFEREFAPRHRVVSLDLPGHGDAAPFPAEEAALLAWMHQRIPAGAVLIGWSLGGLLGLQFARAFPGRLSALVTMATSPCFLRREGWAHGMDPQEFAAFHDAVASDPAAQLRRFALMQAREDVHQRQVSRRLRELCPAHPDAASLMPALESLASRDVRAGLAGLELPVLHILGGQDSIVPASVAAQYENLQPFASVWVLKDVAHAPFLSRPAAVAARIEDFLSARLIRAAPGSGPRKADVARSFGRAAAAYESAANLQRAVGHELLAMTPGAARGRVLDLGSGTGYFSALLGQRFPGAAISGLDIAQGMLRAARARAGLGAVSWVCGDAETMPLADASIGLLFSNLALQWCDDLERCLQEVARVLAPGARALIATLADDTLWELRAAWRAVDDRVHVNRFEHAAALQQAARAAGLRVREARHRYHVLDYPDVSALSRDLRAIGAHNLNAGRPAGLAGRERWRRLQSAYSALADPGGRLPATYRVVCLHLEKPDA